MATNKRFGKKSQGANDFLKPYAPTIGTATDVGTGRAYNDGAATVTFTASGPNAATSYTVTAVEDATKTASGSSSPITVTGLASGTNYTFKVTGTNGYGTGDASSASNQITATTVPQAPSITSATNVPSGRAYNDGRVDVVISANATGGKAISSYASTNGTQSASGATSTLSITGIPSASSATYTATVTNANGTSLASSATASVTATTVPATPSAPTVSTAAVGGSAAQGTANTANDTVSWTAPANGGSALTNYYWASSDGKSGNTTSTSVTVSQESGTAQTYTVRADNANGSSSTSAASASITSAFSFTPFSVFGFSPFAVFGFSPFGFSPFGFSPFGFSPFGFSPFSPFAVFSFSPFGFSPFSPYFKGSLSPSTKVVMADGSLKESELIQIGDQLKSVIIPGLSSEATTIDIENWLGPSDLESLEIVTTTVSSIVTHTSPIYVNINGDGFSGSHLLLVKRDGDVAMKYAEDIRETDLVWSTETNTWTAIESYEKLDYPNNVITISCEPYDLFFTEKSLTHDGYQG